MQYSGGEYTTVNGEPSSRAMEVIRSLDSRSFGFLNLHSSGNHGADSSSFVSREIIQQGIAKLCKELSLVQSSALQAEIYCQLAHWHLLLEQYHEALSAYNQYKSLSPVESTRNPNMHYGLGLIYFHKNAYTWAFQSFKEVLSLAPDFARRTEIHLRLGVMYKAKGNYSSSADYFKRALATTGPASFSKQEIQFHLGHVNYLQGNHLAAKELFEKILSAKNLSNPVKAKALRQLGWLYHSVPDVAATTESPRTKAVELLKLAVGADPGSSQAWYYLGQCHASQGRGREAFMAYQQAITKATDNQAEIWCSIGILYQNMGQARDSLQSYVCAIYLDPASHEAWTDMGCLYESVAQPLDALIAYKNAIIIRQNQHLEDNTGQYLFSRQINLEQYISTVGVGLLQAQPHSLPTVRDAYPALVPVHIRNKNPITTHTPLLDLPSVPVTPSHVPCVNPHGPPQKKLRPNKNVKEPIVIKNMSDSWITPETAGKPVTIDNSGEHSILAQPNVYLGAKRSFSGDIVAHPALHPNPMFPAIPASNDSRLHSNAQIQPMPHSSESRLYSNTPFQSVPHSSDNRLHSSTSLSSELLSNPVFQLTTSTPPSVTQPAISLQNSHPLTPSTAPLPSDLSSISPYELDSSVGDLKEYLQGSSSQESILGPVEGIPRRGSSQMVASYLKELNGDTAQPSPAVSQDSPAPLQIVEGLSDLPSTSQQCDAPQSYDAHSNSSSGVFSSGQKLSPEEVTSPLLSPGYSPPYFLDEDLLDPAHQPFPSLAQEGEYMVATESSLSPPKPPTTAQGVELHPQVPVFQVNTAEDAVSEKLHALCCDPDTPVCMMRGMCSLLGMKLELFSSKNIVKTCPDHEMEVREQVQQSADENVDVNGCEQIWRCESTKQLTTVKQYAKYQKQVKKTLPLASSNGKMIQFGTNIDLSDWEKWGTQLQELEKLPKFLRVDCPEANLLSHLGYSILGLNSVQLYMKVPGSRTPGHQENHNLCSVNINIGPGGCEWFAVDNKFWGVFHDLCSKHNLCFLTGSWWPILKELEELRVPVYRFTQEPGDVVWLNPGTVHWVQANTVCNNIAWNVGPITAHQFRMAWERYHWNKIQKVQSIVPMVHLSWSLAKRVKIIDQSLYTQIRKVLETSLDQTKQLIESLERASIPLKPHVRLDHEPAPCCEQCSEEVFNILFVLSHKGKYLVYCHHCAMMLDKACIVLKQFQIEDLERSLQSFKLHRAPIFQSDVPAL